MNFGKSMLEKYGWQDGDGLGKEKQGISKPIKANLKFDNTGLGHDRGAEFTDHWWERVYNDASNNVNVEKNSNEKITINAIKEESLQENFFNDNKLKYGSFLNSAVLTNEGKEKKKKHPNSFVNSPSISEVKILTDEELLKACGGRTAHKAARHGINLSGKLARIAEQEAILIENMNQVKLKNESKEKDDWIPVKKNKKRKSRTFEQNSEEKHPEDENDLLETIIDNHTDYIKPYSNSKKKMKTKIENNLSEKLMNFSIINEDHKIVETLSPTSDEAIMNDKNSLRTIKKEYKKILKNGNGNLESLNNLKKRLNYLESFKVTEEKAKKLSKTISDAIKLCKNNSGKTLILENVNNKFR